MKPLVGGVRVRENMVKLPAWDPTFVWYAKGVAAMRARALKDPLSWRFQAAIHGYAKAEDPFPHPANALPTAAIRNRFWNQCQHGSWFFLPWHRAYLAFLEHMLVDEIVALGGPNQWALPYWNYSDTSVANPRLLRKEFRDAKLPDGTPNALAQAVRTDSPANPPPWVASGDVGVTPADVGLAALGFSPFTSPPGALGFGGPKTGFHHPPGVSGAVEQLPHNSVHSAVSGWMGSFNTAGLDPVFWCHHANIDRLWVVWRKRNPAFVDPTDPKWLSAAGVSFELYDKGGAIRSFTSKDVVDTKAPLLGYMYDDVSDPLAGAGLADAGVAAVPPQAPETVSLAGASDQPVTLSRGVASARVALAPMAPAAALGGDEQRVYLNIENIVGTDNAATYKVYVDATPAAAAAADEPGRYAGLLPMFGVKEASDPDAQHGASGLTHVFDITDIVGQLKQAGVWDAKNLHVNFVPLRKSEGQPDLKVGRISLYYG